MINRRGLITGLISFAAAPAIVRVESLMKLPVKPKLGQVIRIRLPNDFIFSDGPISLRLITEYIPLDAI